MGQLPSSIPLNDAPRYTVTAAPGQSGLSQDLPPEILLKIFTLVRHSCHTDLSGSTGMWAVSRVCHRWRVISLSEPWFWSQISFNLSTPIEDSTKHRYIPALRTQLTRSSTVPLDVNLYMTHLDGERAMPVYEKELVNIVSQECSRWRILELIAQDCLFNALQSVHGKLENLEDILVVTLDDKLSAPPKVLFGIAPKLLSIRFQFVETPPVLPLAAWCEVESIRIPSACTSLAPILSIQHLYQLELRCYSTWEWGERFIGLAQVLPELKILKTSGIHPGTTFCNITIPKLTHFSYSFDHNCQVAQVTTRLLVDSLLACYRRSQFELEYLEVQCDDEYYSLVDALVYFPSLKELHIRNVASKGSTMRPRPPSDLDFIQSLTVEPASVPLLPKLETLTWDCDVHNPVEWVKSAQRVVASRSEGGEGRCAVLKTASFFETAKRRHAGNIMESGSCACGDASGTCQLESFCRPVNSNY